MASDLKLQVILAGIDKLTRPLRNITQSSAGLGRALKDTRDKLKDLQAQQRDISSLRKQRESVRETSEELASAQQRLRGYREQLKAMDAPSAKFQKSFAQTAAQVDKLKTKHGEQRAELRRLVGNLKKAGISTDQLTQSEQNLKQRIDQANQSITDQEARLKRVTAQQRRLSQARAQYDKAQQLAGNMAAGGAAGLASGYALSRPLKSIVDAFAPAENAATQLKVAMMDQNGQVAADFQRITDLANGLGDRLPGTTADFQNMMTMLRKQGMSTQSILGGTGEAAAYLGVLLQMPVEASAEFAAKMQDATRTSEKDMMALMDTIQRAFYLGVDDTNLLQGFSKLSPAMGILQKEGLEAVNTFAPLLVMMDQTSMAGESAGNALRKVFQASLNTKKLGKANALLKEVGLNLDFSDGKGEFGGIEKLYGQLDKLKSLNSMQRGAVMQALFGDDAETLQVVNTMMDKGLAGYLEVAAKMKAQADLRTRVDEQLGTLTNIIEAAEGSWSNALSEMGETIAPELKEFINDIGSLATQAKEWVKANPKLTATILKVASGVALLLAVGGGLTVMLASLIGPFAMVRYALTLFGIKSLGAIAAIKGVGRALLWTAKALLWIGRALLLNPIGLAVTAIAVSVYLIYKYWEPIKAYFLGLWAEIKAGFNGGLAGIAELILNFSPQGLFYRAFAGVMSLFGVEMPAKFSDFGKLLIQGLIDGIKAMVPALKQAALDAANDGFASLRERLDFIPAIGTLNAGTKLVQQFRRDDDQLRPPPVFDSRPPLTPRAPSTTNIGPTTIQIHAAPGMDTNALARLVDQKLEEHRRKIAARGRSGLSDQE